MAERFEIISDKFQKFISAQHMFFVATAAAEGHVNLSPKGMDSLRVLSDKRVIWLNLTGSGNETAAHMLENPRMTVMFCSFDKQPLILRLYGKARCIHPRDTDWEGLIKHFPQHSGARQIFDLSIELVQSSCGFAVPFYEHQGERSTLKNFADRLSSDELEDYWRRKNLRSLDDKESGILDN